MGIEGGKTDQMNIRVPLAALAALILILGLAACGGSGDSTASESTEATSDPIKAISDPTGEPAKPSRISFNPENQAGHPDDRLEELPRIGNPRRRYTRRRLAAAGYKVKTALDLGSETIARKAVKTGQISGYPEYASTALTSFFGFEPEEVPPTPRRSAGKGKQRIRQGRPADVQPTPFASANAVGMTKETAEKYDLKTISDLEGRLRKTLALRIPRVPPADRLPGRTGKTLRAEVQVVHPGRHRPPLHGAGKGSGGSLDPLHHRSPALGRERQVRHPQRRQEGLPRRQRDLRDTRERRHGEAGSGLRTDDLRPYRKG